MQSNYAKKLHLSDKCSGEGSIKEQRKEILMSSIVNSKVIIFFVERLKQSGLFPKVQSFQ